MTSARSSYSRWSAALTAAFCIALVLTGSRADAQSALLCDPGGPTGTPYDIAIDPVASSLYAIPALSGDVCTYDIAGTTILSTGNVVTPFVQAAPPLFLAPQVVGVAVDSLGTVWGLQNEVPGSLNPCGTPPCPNIPPSIQSFDATGMAISTLIPLTDPTPANRLAGATLRGLTADINAGTLWTRDVIADVLLEIDPVSGELLNSFDLPLSSIGLLGSGVHAIDNGGTTIFEITAGDIFTGVVDRVIRVDTTGSPLGVQFELPNPEGALGISRSGDDIFVVREFGPGGGTTRQIDRFQAIPPVLNPVGDLRARADLSGAITIDWLLTDTYDTLIVDRDGVVVLDDPTGTATTVTDAPPPGTFTYTVTTTSLTGSATRSVEVIAGSGALIDALALDQQITGIALNPRNIGDPSDDLYYVLSGRNIIVIDANLNVLSPTISLGSGGSTRSIAFSPSRNEAYVASSSGALIERFLVDPVNATGAWIANNTFGVTNATGLQDMTVLEAVTSTGIDTLWVIAQRSGRELVALSLEPAIVNGNPVGEGFELSSLAPANLGRGISTLPATSTAPDGSLLIASENGSGAATEAVEIVPPSPVSASLSVELSTIGFTATAPGALSALARRDAELWIVGDEVDALFRIAIAASGGTFLRGDFDGNLMLELADAIGILAFLFQSGPAPTCLDAADANDDGLIDISDALNVLFGLFMPMGPMPAPPFPVEGTDPTPFDPYGC